MTVSQREIELKLELDERALARLKTARPPTGFSVERAVTRALRSIYFDTPDLALKADKWSLRVRKVGRSWIQTVKSGTRVSGGLSTPREYEIRVDAPVPDLTRIVNPAIREGLWKRLGGAPLDSVFETDMRRTTRIFTTETGTRIELALDSGVIRAGARDLPLFEAEFELVSGPIEHLFTLATHLKGTENARFSTTSKAGRGYRLLSGKPPHTAEPQTAVTAQIREKDTALDAFRAILRVCRVQIAANRDAIIASDDPEGPHQMRVGLRRLRSALKVYRGHIDPKRFDTLDDTAQTLAARVGALRDLDVLTDEIVAPVQEVASASFAVDALFALIASERKAERQRVREAVLEPGVNRLLFDLGAVAEGDDWRRAPEEDVQPGSSDPLSAPAAVFARAALNKRWKAVVKLGARIDDLTLEERHDLRKRLKKMRYVLEFYQPVFKPKAIKPFLKTLKRLQNVFGYLNDVVMAKQVIELADRAEETEKRGLLIAAGFVTGWHERRAEDAWSHARALWDDTRHAEKFWR